MCGSGEGRQLIYIPHNDVVFVCVCVCVFFVFFFVFFFCFFFKISVIECLRNKK